MSTDLFEVIRRNSFRQVKLVLEAGYDVNARNERLETPLMASVMHVHDSECRLGIIKLLVSSGADINLQNSRGQTVVMYGCILDQFDTVTQLLQFNNLNVDLTDTDGNTALMYACALGHYDTVKMILDSYRAGQHCVDLHRKNYDGMGAIEHAAEAGHLDVVKLVSSFTGETDSNQGISNMAPDTEWAEEVAPNPSPTNHKHQPLNEKMHRFIQEVQDACVDDTCEAFNKELIPPSPCVGLASPTVIIAGNEQFIKKEVVTSPGPKDKNAHETGSKPSASARPPSRSRHLRSAARRTLEQYSDEEPELSLASLGELVTTVRECAREIREICHHPEDGREEKLKRTKKGKGPGKKGKADKFKNVVAEHSFDHKRRRAFGTGSVMKERKQSEQTEHRDDSLCQTWPKRSSSSLSVRKSASNTTLNREAILVKTPSPSVSPHHGEIRDKSLIHEKQILDKVFCRLNSSKVIWGDDSDLPESKAKSSHHSYRASKTTMLARDQFSSYGHPLPMIHRPTANLPPVRDGARLRQMVHAQLQESVQTRGTHPDVSGDSYEDLSDGEAEEGEDEGGKERGCAFMSM